MKNAIFSILVSCVAGTVVAADVGTTTSFVSSNVSTVRISGVSAPSVYTQSRVSPVGPPPYTSVRVEQSVQRNSAAVSSVTTMSGNTPIPVTIIQFQR